MKKYVNSAHSAIVSLPTHARVTTSLLQVPLPEHFSWRDQDVDLEEVQDQGSCGSCWAVSSTSVLSDRVTIAQKLKRNPRLSATMTGSCAMDTSCQEGGLPFKAGVFFEEKGVVGDACWPYSFVLNSKRLPACSEEPSSCLNQQRYFAKKGSTRNLFGAHQDPAHTISLIKHEIINHGPVVATFRVFNDFVTWWQRGCPGVYRPNSQSGLDGWHAVVLTGWGIHTDGTPFWEMRNSWGLTGDKNTGYGRMPLSTHVRPENHIGLDYPVDGTNGGVTTFLASMSTQIHDTSSSPSSLSSSPSPSSKSPNVAFLSVLSILLCFALVAFIYFVTQTNQPVGIALSFGVALILVIIVVQIAINSKKKQMTQRFFGDKKQKSCCVC